jgi:hypothetical protein
LDGFSDLLDGWGESEGADFALGAMIKYKMWYLLGWIKAARHSPASLAFAGLLDQINRLRPLPMSATVL